MIGAMSIRKKRELTNKLNVRQSRSPSLASARSGASQDSFRKPGSSPHSYVPRSGSGRTGNKPPFSRGCVKRTKGKGKKGKKGCRDTYDLIVNIDLAEWQLTDEQVAEFKEVFMLFDKDEDGVLTFPELNVVMKSLGQRPTERELLTMVRDVSEDHIYDTIEFNEFLQMMSKQQKFGVTQDSLKDAFRIFDKDEDGFLSVQELRYIMQSLGEKMNEIDLGEMICEADSDKDGLINYEEFVQVLCSDKKSKCKKKQKGKPEAQPVKKKVEKQVTVAPTTTTVIIEDDPDKENAVLHLSRPSELAVVQGLNGSAFGPAPARPAHKCSAASATSASASKNGHCVRTSKSAARSAATTPASESMNHKVAVLHQDPHHRKDVRDLQHPHHKAVPNAAMHLAASQPHLPHK